MRPWRPSFAFLAMTLVVWLTSALALAAPKGGRGKSRDDDGGEKTHTVAEGQTLAKIAKRYLVSVDALRDANDLKPGEKLHAGMKLVIPVEESRKGRKGAKEKADDEDDSDNDRGKKRGRASRDDDRDEERDDDKADRSDRSDRGDKAEGKRKGRGDSKGKKKGSHDDDDDRAKAGHIKVVGGSESWEGKVVAGRGKLTPAAISGISKVLQPEGGKHPINKRLLLLLSQVSDHFEGRTIEVVSGFRPVAKGQHTPKSKHNVGSAIDFHVEGVSNEEVRDYCRTLKNVGVGYYPNSHFVHLDVRPASAYWVDVSAPGEAPRYTKGSAKEADAEVAHHPTPGS